MKDNVSEYLSSFPITGTTPQKGTANQGFGTPGKGNTNTGRFSFIRNLTSLFGFRRSSPNKRGSINNVEFLKVDSNSDLRLAQAKIGKTFSTKMTGKLGELFDSWLKDTDTTYKILEDRNKRLAELEFMIMNDSFISQAVDLFADEATQIDVNGKLIQVDCADQRMKEEMEDLMEQWGITQNRLRTVAYNLAGYGDAFWANKVTKNGVVRITPIGIHQVKERLEFNPVQVQTDITLQKGYITAINRSSKLQALFDTLEAEENEEFADLWDTKLFGFAIDDDMVVPPYDITHFRLNPDQSTFAPMGTSLFLKALAPFRQCNATMVLQSLARVMSFPVTVYNVKTAPGMDEGLQFDKINQIREEYENIGDSGAGTEAFSVNTKIWAPDGLLRLEMQTPDIDINATSDIEMYQDRVAVASGIPKGYLVQEWGGFGNSAISLVEQFKPFARKVFTIQSAMLDGLSNLFRLHFAITGKYDYRESFILSMKFPNEESSDARLAAKQNSLNLSQQVLQTVAGIIGAINNPLPPEVIQDIMIKFSFLDPDDIKKWLKPNPNAKAQTGAEEGQPEEFGGGGGMGGAPPMGSGADMGMGGEGEGLGGAEAPPPPAEGTEAPPPAGASEPNPLSQNLTGTAHEQARKTRNYKVLEEKVLFEEKQKKIVEAYKSNQDLINERVIKLFERVDESQMNNRHYKYSRLESCNEPMYKLFQKKEEQTLHEETDQEQRAKVILTDDRLSWAKIKEMLNTPLEGIEGDSGNSQRDRFTEEINTDIEHTRKIQEML